MFTLFVVCDRRRNNNNKKLIFLFLLFIYFFIIVSPSFFSADVKNGALPPLPFFLYETSFLG